LEADLVRKSRAFGCEREVIRGKYSSLRKSPTFGEADLVRKSRAFGCEREVIRGKYSSLRKSPTFWEADLVRKSRAFLVLVKRKRKPKARLFGMQIWLVKVGLFETM